MSNSLDLDSNNEQPHDTLTTVVLRGRTFTTIYGEGQIITEAIPLPSMEGKVLRGYTTSIVTDGRDVLTTELYNHHYNLELTNRFCYSTTWFVVTFLLVGVVWVCGCFVTRRVCAVRRRRSLGRRSLLLAERYRKYSWVKWALVVLVQLAGIAGVSAGTMALLSERASIAIANGNEHAMTERLFHEDYALFMNTEPRWLYYSLHVINVNVALLGNRTVALPWSSLATRAPGVYSGLVECPCNDSLYMRGGCCEGHLVDHSPIDALFRARFEIRLQIENRRAHRRLTLAYFTNNLDIPPSTNPMSPLRIVEHHILASQLQASPFAVAYALGHCHVGCVRMELWMQGTRICQTVPVYDQHGYVVSIPPCVWSAHDSPIVATDQMLTSIMHVNATDGHWGQMAHWQMAVHAT